MTYLKLGLLSWFWWGEWTKMWSPWYYYEFQTFSLNRYIAFYTLIIVRPGVKAMASQRIVIKRKRLRASLVGTKSHTARRGCVRTSRDNSQTEPNLVACAVQNHLYHVSNRNPTLIILHNFWAIIYTTGIWLFFSFKNSSTGIPKLKPMFSKTQAFSLKNSSKFCKIQFFGNFELHYPKF